MHRRTLRLTAARAVFGLVACIGLLAAGASETVDVKRALDGDSLLLVDGRQVRLIGVNAPELGKDGAPHQPLAVEARALTARHTEGRRVTLDFDRERLDRHGRTLAYVSVSGADDLQDMLVRSGLAWFVAVAPNLARVARYRAAEDEARANRRGIWADPAYRPKPAEHLRPSDAGFQRVLGKVQRVERREQILYLALTPGFHLLIAHSDWGNFGGRPADWAGRTIVARGWVAAHNGVVHMRVSHPAMLETVEH